jgi:NAD(P)-dependent dehydrogenase (short-subunit alcohol dehydrogenase family)
VTPRTVVIIGAQGGLGSIVVRAFADAGWSVLRGGRRPDQGADFQLVDLDRPDTVRRAIAGADLVVDVVPHPGLAVERAVLRDGGALIEVSARPAAASRRLRDRERDPRGLVIMNAGHLV